MNVLHRLVALALLLVAMMANGGSASAQTPPSELVARVNARGARDLVDGPLPEGMTLTVPALPDDHVTERRGPLVISYPRALRPVVEVALRRAERDARSVATQFGMREIPELQVRLVSDADMMRRLAPVEFPPPAYAVGVAYPAVRLALVSATAPRTWEASNMAQVLKHELSHLLLAEAAHHAAVPRWLAEGVAVHQADEHSFERFQELATASWTGRLLPLGRLDEGFSEGPVEVNAAYAESADFVGYLVRTDGSTRFAILVEHLRDGEVFEEAMAGTYGAPMGRIEEEWRRDLDGRVAFAPLWAGTGVLSVAGAGLVVVALFRRWRKNRATRDRWDREESKERMRWAFVSRPSLRLVASPAEERGEEGLPGVAREGERRTLH